MTTAPRRRLPLTMAALLALGAAGPAANAASGKAIEAVLACRRVDIPGRQLTCFLKASAALAAEQNAPGPPVSLPAVASSFGARPPRAPRPARAAEPRQATLRVESISDPGDGRLLFAFADGSVWRESEAAPIGGALKAGQDVTLEKGMLGSTFLDIRGRAAIRVARIGSD